MNSESTDSDEHLMARYRDGDAQAFDRLYERHRGPVFRYLQRQCGAGAITEELFQDVWMRLIGARERYRIEAKFTTYLYRIARNRVIDHFRARERAPVQVADIDQVGDAEAESAGNLGAAPAPRPEDSLEHERMRRRLLAALQTLPRDQVDAFLLHEEAGLTLEEIATVVGVGRETVKSRLRYAIRRLREHLGEDEKTPDGARPGREARQ